MYMFKRQRGQAVGFSMFLLAVFLLVAIPYMQAIEDRKSLGDLKDGYQAFLAYGEEERLRALGFDIALDGVYKGEGRLGGHSATITYEFKDGVVTKRLETIAEEFNGKAAFIQNGPEVSYSAIEGDVDLFPSTPEIFVATPEGRIYSAFSRASMAHIPASQVAAEKERGESFWGLIKNILTSLIAVTATLVVVSFLTRMHRMSNKPQ